MEYNLYLLIDEVQIHFENSPLQGADPKINGEKLEIPLGNIGIEITFRSDRHESLSQFSDDFQAHFLSVIPGPAKEELDSIAGYFHRLREFFHAGLISDTIRYSLPGKDQYRLYDTFMADDEVFKSIKNLADLLRGADSRTSVRNIQRIGGFIGVEPPKTHHHTMGSLPEAVETYLEIIRMFDGMQNPLNDVGRSLLTYAGYERVQGREK
jgi:hypothetical protein